MLSVKDLHKYYRSKKGEEYHALKGLNIDFPTKGFVFIIGKSGSGKSTLLNVLGGLDRYDTGEIFIKGKSSKTFNAKEWDSYRNTYLGFVFQDFNIIDSYSIGANISLALQLQGIKASEAKPRTREILESVEALELIDRKPNELSGGQKQRIAIARALVKNPEIIIADEPTGNLDSETSAVIMSILERLAKERLVIMVTHDLDFANDYGDRVIEMRDGEIIKDFTKENKTQETVQIFKSERNQDEKAIKLPKGTSLTQDSVDAINALIRKHPNQNIYLTASVDPEIAGIVSKKALNAESAKAGQVKVELDYTVQGTFNLIKSKLPFNNSFKMALNSIWTKKFKLLFAVILFIASIGLFGFSRTVTRFDFPMAATLSYDESGTDRVFISKQDTVMQPWGEEETVDGLFTRAEADELDRSTQLAMGLAYDFSSPIRVQETQSNTLVEAKQIKGLLEIESLASMNLSLVAGAFPATHDEVMITDYVADQLITTTYQAYLDTDPTLDLPFKTVNVVGVIATDYADYEFLNALNTSQLTAEQAAVLAFNNSDTNLYSRMVVGTGFYEAYDDLIEVMMNYYGVSVYLESRENDNDFPYEQFSDSFMNNDHPVMDTDYVQFFDGYSSIPDNGVIVDLNAYQRLLQVLGNISEETQLEYLYDWSNPLSGKVDRLEADGHGALSISAAFNDSVNNAWTDRTDMVVVGVLDMEGYRQNVILPEAAQVTLDESNVTYVPEDEFFRYAGGAHQEYLDALARIHLSNYPTYEDYVNDGGNDWFMYYSDLSDALEDEDVLFIRDSYIYGYIQYLSDRLSSENVTVPSYTSYASSEGNNPYGYAQGLRELVEMEGITFINDEDFGEKYLMYGENYSQYLIQQVRENDLEIESVYSDLYGASILSTSFYNEINPYSRDKVHGLVIQLSDDIDQNYGFFLGAESIGISHLTPSGNLLQIFAEFTTEADVIFAYVSLGVAGFAALLLFLNISASILAKKKEIGTLRAMGARGNDVASIFVNEALLLGLFSVSLAIVGIIVATLQLNGFLSNQLGQTLAIFNISPIIMGEMILLTMVIVLIASFLPVKRVSSMKPIDAIKNK